MRRGAFYRVGKQGAPGPDAGVELAVRWRVEVRGEGRLHCRKVSYLRKGRIHVFPPKSDPPRK